VSAGVGMDKSLRIESREELEAWLKDKPVEWARIIAMRSALRVLPFVNRALGEWAANPRNERIVLSTFRAAFLSWVGVQCPTYGIVNVARAARAAVAAYSYIANDAYFAADAARAVTFAAANTFATDTFTATAFVAATDAARAVTLSATAFADAHSAVWLAVFSDVEALEREGRRSPISISGSPIWPDSMPDLARRERISLNDNTGVEELGFGLWLMWLDGASEGRPPRDVFGEELTLRIADQSDAWWGRPVREVNADVARWLDEEKSKKILDFTAPENDQLVVSTGRDLTDVARSVPRPDPSTMRVLENAARSLFHPDQSITRKLNGVMRGISGFEQHPQKSWSATPSNNTSNEPLLQSPVKSAIRVQPSPATEKTEANAKRKIRYFVSYAHDDEPHVSELVKRLHTRLSMYKKFEFERWDDKMIPVGERWKPEILKAIAACPVGLLIISPAFLSSKFIVENELRGYVSPNPETTVSNRHAIPVALEEIPFGGEMDLKGLDELQVFLHNGRHYLFYDDGGKREFVSNLCKKIYESAERWASISAK